LEVIEYESEIVSKGELENYKNDKNTLSLGEFPFSCHSALRPREAPAKS